MSMFITESMRICAASPTSLVPRPCAHPVPSEPAGLRIDFAGKLEPSAQERLAGNISRRMPFLIGGGAGEGALRQEICRAYRESRRASSARRRFQKSSARSSCITPPQLLSFLFRITSPQTCSNQSPAPAPRRTQLSRPRKSRDFCRRQCAREHTKAPTPRPFAAWCEKLPP